jgi:sulfonate transport system ATP-binding protein
VLRTALDEPVRAPMPEIIAFEGVSKSFPAKNGEVQATRNIDVRVQEGEIVTIVGPSGCGKTTMLNLVAGLIRPTAGSVSYRDEPIASINRRTGYMTQSDHLLPWRDVASNIAVPLEIQGVARVERQRRVDELMALVGLTGFESTYPSRLSGGMKKRTALARLLAYDPETLLLDEPFAALDAQLRMKMQMELFSLSRRFNKTVLFVTHDLDEAIALGDRCLVFSARPGTIVKDVQIPLSRERDIVGLKRDTAYRDLCAELWGFLEPVSETQAP